LDFAFGYRCEDSRQNAYFNADGKIVYMTAALGVILDADAKQQTFFGGEKVQQASKHNAKENYHTNDVTSLAVSDDRKSVVSGQVGKFPTVFIWDSATAKKKVGTKLNKNSRRVNAVCMMPDGGFVAVDESNDHQVFSFDNNGKQIFSDKGDQNKIFDIAAAPGNERNFLTVGKRHIKFWTPTGSRKSRRGIFGDYEATSFASCAYHSGGKALTGGCNGKIYCWNEQR
jgi:WD40 repeat protein